MATLPPRSAPPPGAARRRHPRRGTTSVEFALVSPVLFLIVFGIIELGRALMVMHLLTSAAREGCRTAVIQGASNQDVTPAVLDKLKAQGVGGVRPPVIKVNGAAADVATAQPRDEITVVVAVPVSQVSWIPGWQYLQGDLSGQYTLRRE